ncbi:MAG: glycoside hydrolase family 15 protein [Acidiferrobacteraceae bacterium]
MSRPIEDYALIGNTLTAALVSRQGSIDWLCMPDFGSPACLAALLGTPDNGYWSICPPNGSARITRKYRDDTLILETRFDTEAGAVELIDFMPPPRAGGAIDVVRMVHGVAGRVPLRMEAAFRCEYGTVVPWVRYDGRRLSAIAGPEALFLYTPVRLRGEGLVTVADFNVSAAETVSFVLTRVPSHAREPREPDPLKALAATEAWWRRWLRKGRKRHGPYQPVIDRSAITLKALTYSPTGGVVAAPTTSLPERIGGVRNWDYRYCWVRDATFTLYALHVAGYRKEARAWRDWLLRAVAGEPAKTQIMYGLRGERRLDEYELPWLAGYAESRPVRVGNAAYQQRQMDIYGELMDALYFSRRHGLAKQEEDSGWRIQCALMDFLEGHWQEPDRGLWEERGGDRQHVFSKVMAWVAADRSIKTIEHFGAEGPLDRWRHLRDLIHQDVCRQGYNPERGAFVQTYGSRTMDASLLLLPLVGFLPVGDPRIQGTVRAIEQELLCDGFVMRYTGGSDGLPGGEGAFLACSLWLADNYALMDRKADAEAVFQRVLGIGNDVGLLSEEYDPRAKRLVGNFPQAFSHVGVINTAVNLYTETGPAVHRSKPGGHGPAGA